jgi:hypothetical protein
MRSWLLAVALTFVGCDQSEPLSIQKAPAYLYATLDDCEWTARVGPDEPFSRPPRGIVGEIPPGTTFSASDQYIGKDTACYAVEYKGIKGFVLGSCGRVDTPGRKCGWP